MDKFDTDVTEVYRRFVREEGDNISREQAAARAAHAQRLADPELRKEFLAAITQRLAQQDQERQARLQREAAEDFSTQGASAVERSHNRKNQVSFKGP